MKRVFSLLVFMFLLNGCDDGNLTLETINFENAQTQSCSNNNVIYKLKEKEALLLELDKSIFVNEPTDEGKPIVIDINNTTNRVIYKFYDGKVEADNICNTITPARPFVTDQWVATSGKIEITTSILLADGSIPGSTVIKGYNHRIIFKNSTFQKTNGTQVYETFVFGDYVTTATALTFGFDKTLEQCSSNKDVYNSTSSGEVLMLNNLDASLIVNVETPINSPRTAVIGAVNNKLTYRLYTNGLFAPNFFCNPSPPISPSVNEEWTGTVGTANANGIIEVSTIKSGTTAYKHSIVLKKATLKKRNSSFILGDAYPLGELITF